MEQKGGLVIFLVCWVLHLILSPVQAQYPCGSLDPCDRGNGLLKDTLRCRRDCPEGPFENRLSPGEGGEIPQDVRIRMCVVSGKKILDDQGVTLFFHPPHSLQGRYPTKIDMGSLFDDLPATQDCAPYNQPTVDGLLFKCDEDGSNIVHLEWDFGASDKRGNPTLHRVSWRGDWLGFPGCPWATDGRHNAVFTTFSLTGSTTDKQHTCTSKISKAAKLFLTIDIGEVDTNTAPTAICR